jgi:hypothetical protein
MQQQPEKVELQCIKQGSKLRVRILTPGYYRDANCQFPRDLRVEGRHFKVSPSSISLITSRGKYYYSITSRAAIEVINAANIDLNALRIYEDADTADCAICMALPKDSVMYPCGHFYTCNECSKKLSTCPICRQKFTQIIPKANIG